MHHSVRPLRLLLALTGVASASTSLVAAAETELTKQQLVELYPELKVDDIADSPAPGFYEISLRGEVFYVSKDGKFMLRGDLTELKSQRNLTEVRRAEHRAELLATLDPKSEIVFAPKDGKARYRIIVFTDVDCGYCRALHRHIDDITALGIEVHYVSYPRTGPNTESWTRAEHVWCASDRNAALTLAKAGGDATPAAGCKTAPIAAHYALGRAVGMTGTPAIYAETGEDVGGYAEPDVLLSRLQKIAAAH
jgi:thiol:disulfide interchange protein DsbC